MNRRAFLVLPLAARAASTALYGRLLRSLEQTETIDTHEHILREAARVEARVDFFTLSSHYANNDVISAGMPAEHHQQMPNPDIPAEQKWKWFEPWWTYAKFTGYGEALRIAMRDIYGVEDINGRTLAKLNEAIAAKNKPGLYADILKRRCNLKFAVNDEYWQPAPVGVNPDFFVLARKFEQWVTPVTRQGLSRLEKSAGQAIGSVRDLKRALEKQFERSLEVGMVTVKTTIAYHRDLRFEEVSEPDAQRAFEGLLKDAEPYPEAPHLQMERRPYRALSDHMFHHLVRLADAHKVPVQIHTGLHAGNGNYVTNSRPTDLTNLFFLFPRVQFDLFHIGYPYWRECGVLAKTFPNVNVDFCWMHIVSPTGARAALHEMLETVPANKIFGFGGDYRYPELSYAHLVMARRNIAQVLAEKVEQKSFTEDDALRIGQWMMRDNPARLFSPRGTQAAGSQSA